MDKAVLTLDKILARYFYKDWVQDELRDVGESISGDMNQLIKRFLGSDRIRRKPVDEIAVSLLSSLRTTDLRLIATDLGAEAQGRHGQLLKRILSLVVFEPYVKRTTRYCTVCLKETHHELHFGVDWQADRFKCEVCGTTTSVRSIKDENRGSQSIPPPVIDIQWTESNPVSEDAQTKGNLVVSSEEQTPAALIVTPVVASGDDGGDSLSDQALAWTIASCGVAVFVAVSLPVGLSYGWSVGIISGIVSVVLAGGILIPTRHRWMKVLLKMVR